MPISIAPLGTELTIRKVVAEQKVNARLRELGLCEGEKVKLISSENGSVILAVKEGRLCLDKNIALKILVS